MKKIYLTLSLGALILGANAQQSFTKVNANRTASANENLNYKASAITTQTVIQITTQTTTSISIAGISSSTSCPGGGYVEGNNCIGDIEKANFFPAASYAAVTSSSIVAVEFAFYKQGNKGVSGSANTVTCSIYNGSLAGGPTGSAIGYATASLSQIIAAQTGTNPVVPYTFTLTPSVVTPASGFFAAISLPSSVGDTIVVWNENTSSSSFGWEKKANNAWVDMGTFWSSAFGSPYKANLSIYPILVGTLDPTAGIKSIDNNLTLLAAFPNPATNDVSINFGLNKSSKVDIELYDVTGKIVNTIKLDNLEAGDHTTKIDVSSLNAGVYMYSVKSDNAKLFSKFTVVK